MEIWKDIIGLEGYYQVSNLGRVKSLERTIQRTGAGPLNVKERIIKQGVVDTGYLRVALRFNCKYIGYQVHRLLALHFIPQPETNARLCVNHIDGNKLNNSLENLEWVTWRENISHGFKGELPPCIRYNKNKTRFRVVVRNGKNRLCLGTFDTIEIAKKAHTDYLESEGLRNKYA